MSVFSGLDGWCEFENGKCYHIVIGIESQENTGTGVTLCYLKVNKPGTVVYIGEPKSKLPLCRECARRL